MILRSFQEQAANRIISAYNDNSYGKATICVPAGFGVSRLLAECINRILKVNSDAKVLYLCGRREEKYLYN